jgi:diguanylate cyclase (GGDEF)-like protein
MKKMDTLTGDVYNIDVFQILLNYEIARSKRYPCPLTLIEMEMTPIAFNSEAISDAPLIFSAALNAHLRSADIPARSGNFFTILLPNSDKHGAQAVCERLLSVFKNKFEDANGNSVTFSLHMGVTTHSGGEKISSEGLVEKAKEGLLQSKRKGANTFVFLA